MTNLIDIKRNSLETFIREQMIGPNGCRGRYTLSDSSFDSEREEIINTTPGSIYSTAILFPKKEQIGDLFSGTNQNQTKFDENPDLEDLVEEDNDNTTSDTIEQNGSYGIDVDEDDVYSLSRRFPTTIGLSCCLANNTNFNKDLNIVVSGRYYSKVIHSDKQKVQVIIEGDISGFENFWNKFEDLRKYFIYSDAKLSALSSARDVLNVKSLLKNINLICADSIASQYNLKEKGLGVKDNYRYLLAFREAIYHKKLSPSKAFINEDERNAYVQVVKDIEKAETYLSYFEDLLDLYAKNSYGFWQSHSFSVPINLSSIKFNLSSAKTIFNPDSVPELDKIVCVDLNNAEIAGTVSSDPSQQQQNRKLVLGVWLQITRNTKDDSDENYYLKVLLENRSTPFQEDKRHYYSIVNEKVNQLCFFGVGISVESDKLVPYHNNSSDSNPDIEKDNLDFLYRDIKDYGVGHLCSVDWSIGNDNSINKVFTEFIPSYETPDIEPIPRNKYEEFIVEKGIAVSKPFLNDNTCLQFKWLSTFSNASDEEIIKSLKSFVGTYDKWIEISRANFQAEDISKAEQNLSKCKEDCDRMMANIRLILESDSKNMLVFRLMNSAMFMQLWHNNKKNQESVKNIREITSSFYSSVSDYVFNDKEHVAWRPFQLAFILLNLDGIIQTSDDTNWKYRNEIVDLVWFPTGGGKTEAYLGLIALCIINRRLRFGKQGYGVASIMRYTLRLLTTQQFQRAMRLILALEQIRLWDDVDKDLGSEPISLGLFVGSGSLPNSKKDLEEEAVKWNNKDISNKSKIPLDKCPWCGEPLEFDNHEFRCSNIFCTFKDSVPVKLCDDSIYSTPPTLLFGTVDKFASLAHKVSTGSKPGDKSKDSRRIFGKGINVLPPDLIIQDELHLLLGPLGSAVALFECAIDQLCTRKQGNLVVRPKIISSTATTRNTNLQIRALYDRGVNIFPKNGVSYDDSFFAFYKRTKVDNKVNYVSKRKYIGIMPTGRTQMTTQMRLSAILLVHRAIFEKLYGSDPDFESVANNYYSVISYFNSLKEVGKTDALFYTEYAKYMRRLFKRVLRFGDLLDCHYMLRDLLLMELSGRLTATEVNESFTSVALNWKAENRLRRIEGGEDKPVSLPPDYILATNMISVGLDVSRFNTIIMNSMPRNVAEYIQASSRVARNVSGLVLTLHNPFRSRDVSHFEKYREFHEKLYYYVEPISITPFSQKSIEKYMPLYMATIMRHSFEKLADRNSASRITSGNLREQVKQTIEEYFRKRYQRTVSLPDELSKELLSESLLANINQYVDNALDQWINMATENPNNLVYNYPKDNVALFTSIDSYDDSELSFWKVPMSLRIVEPEAVLKINVNYGN